MRNKRLLLFLLFVLFYGIRSVAWTTSKSAIIDGIRYYVIIGYAGDSSTAIVEKGEDCSGDITIPSSINVSDMYGTKAVATVISIADSAFSGCKNITSISIPADVKSIGEGVFDDCPKLEAINMKSNKYYTSLYGVLYSKGYNNKLVRYPEGKKETIFTIPNDVSEIGEDAFKNCENLTALNANEANQTYTSIDGVLYSKDKTTIERYPTGRKDNGFEIPSFVESLGWNVFKYCKNLTSITISCNVKCIFCSFDYCSNLETINVDHDNEYYTSDDGVLYDKSMTNLRRFPEGKKRTSFVMPNTVEHINSYGFRNCEIAQVTISNRINTIDSYAFAYSKISQVILHDNIHTIKSDAFFHSKITSINIPSSVTNLYYNKNGDPFGECFDLTAINVDNSNSEFCSENGILYNKDKSTILRYPQKHPTTSFTIPDFVTNIGDYAFQNCSKLTNLTIPNSVTGGVGVNAFDNCSELNDLFIYVTNNVLNLSLNGVELKYSMYMGGVGGKCSVHVPAGLYDEYKKIEPFSNHVIVSENLLLTGFDYSIIKTSVSPTCVTLKAKFTDSFFHIAEIGVEGQKIEDRGDSIIVKSLKPGTYYKRDFYAMADDGYKETRSFNFTTSALELATLQPKCVSSSCAIVAAKTNISDDESSVGFQWKKYDAPESLNPNEGYAAIYNGQLEGYIKNLQPTSYYNVRAFYKSSDEQYYYGEWITFDPSDFSYFEPTVHTYNVTNVTATTAKVKGYVLAGTDDITEQGFEYRPLDSNDAKKWAMIAAAADNPGDDVITVFATGQVMTAELRDLKPETTYTCRAFVKTATSTTYGEEQTFTTTADVTGIATVDADASKLDIEGCYDLSGRKIDTMQHGINIIRYTDGTTRKVFVR